MKTVVVGKLPPWLLALLLGMSWLNPVAALAMHPERHTKVSIVGEAFHINGRPTYEGRTWHGHKIEGLLLNARLVQGIFDDLNPETVGELAARPVRMLRREASQAEVPVALWRRTVDQRMDRREGVSPQICGHVSACLVIQRRI